MSVKTFMTEQTAIREAAQSAWERWTIDEVDEGIVRVLVSQANDPTELREIVERITGEAEQPPPVRVLRDRLHRAAMAVELAPTEDQWSEEGSMFVMASILEPFLREREGKPGLPTNRPLREGDVFWILLPGFPLAVPPARGASLAAGAERVVTFQQRHGDVWDVTAAARQATKHDYHRALELSEEPPPGQEPRGG